MPRRKKTTTKATIHQHPIAHVKLRSLPNGVGTFQEQLYSAKEFVSQLNEALIKEQDSLSTVLEGRLAARNGDLVLEIFCALSSQLSIFMDRSDIERDVDPDELLHRARGRWANALTEALVKEESTRQDLPSLATAATRLKVDDDGVLSPLLGPDEIGPTLNREIPGDATHATQGSNEFDLNGDSAFSSPVWETPCTIRARPELARKGVDLWLIYSPAHHGKKARASIEDISEADLKIIAVAAKRKVGIWLDVQLATSLGRSRFPICKVLGIGKENKPGAGGAVAAVNLLDRLSRIHEEKSVVAAPV